MCTCVLHGRCILCCVSECGNVRCAGLFGCAVASAVWRGVLQVQTADWSDRLNLNHRFVSNNWVGGLVFAGIVAGNLL